MDDQKNEMLTGSIPRQIFRFALPIAATNILQQLFNSADTAVVGRFASSQALAAVGSTSSVVNLCITILTGFAVGANVRIAYLIGAGEKEKIKKGVSTAMWMAVVVGLLLTLIGELGAVPLLKVMKTPDDILDAAVLYVRIYFAGILFLTIYNFEAAVLRAAGDSRHPLYCLTVSGALNVVFNLVFVVGFHLGVAGVALGTLISSIINVFLLFYYLKRDEILQFDFAVRPDWGICRTMIGIGLPAALQGMMFNISNLIIQTGLNGLGSQVVAASTIGVNAEIFIYYLVNGFGQAAVTFNGQNIGAGNRERCRKAGRVSLVMCGAMTIVMILGFLLFARQMCALFSTDPEVIELAILRIRVVLAFELFNMSIEVISGMLRGLGHSTLPAGISAICVCLTRILYVLLIFPHYHTMAGLLVIYPISWILDAAVLIVCYCRIARRELTTAAA